jgi:hypothetical protein
MRKRLQALGFSFTSDFDALVGKFAAAQDYREKSAKSDTHELTRTTALAVVLFEAPEIQSSLLSFGLSYEKFLARAGLINFSFGQESQTDVDVFFSLDDAITRYVRSEKPVLQTSKEVFAILILEDVFATPATFGELGGALRSCGLDLSELSAALRTRSLPFDPRRPSPRTDNPEGPAAFVPSLRNGKPSPDLGGLPPQHPPEPAATTPFYSDHPAQRDLLNRKAVAETIATMIESVWREDDREELNDRSFIVHLHGRWGSGKTSILNFYPTHCFGPEQEADSLPKRTIPRG